MQAACSTPPAAVTPPPGRSPEVISLEERASTPAYTAKGAYVSQDRLLIVLASAGEETVATARLPGQRSARPAGDPGEPDQRVRAVWPLSAPQPEPLPDGAQPVPILPAEQWRALLRGAQDAIAPDDPRYGAAIDVLSQHELFVYRDRDGSLRSVPIEYKPADMRIARSYPLDRLLGEYVATHRDLLPSPKADARAMLFETGDSQPDGYPFVLVEPERRALAFLHFAPTASASPPSLGAPALARAGAHTVTGQVRSAIEQPVTSMARLLTLVTSTTTDLLRPDAVFPHPSSSEPVMPVTAGTPMDLEAWERELDALVGQQVYPGKVRFLVDGGEYFPALVNAIEDAQRTLDMRVYIFDNDDYAVWIADLLKQRSRQIRVRILLDGLGTVGGGAAQPGYLPPGHRAPESIVAHLTENSSIRVRVLSNPWMAGDHTKTIVIDDALAYIGGMNIGREYRYEWHDLMVEVTGPAVDALRADFGQTWNAQVPLGEFWSRMQVSERRNPTARPGDYPVRVLQTRTGNSQILRAQIAAIRQTRQRIYIQNAYFTSDAILRELAAARRRGVDVRVILPYRNDSGVIHRANAIAANFMLANGIRVYIYPGMSHVKGAVYDGWACFGSANFDNLSMVVNRELNLATSHPPAVDEFVERIFDRDMRHSVELTQPFPPKWNDFLTELLSDRL